VRTLLLLSLPALVLCGCFSSGTLPDGGEVDPVVDAGTTPDAGSDADAGADPDAGSDSDAGFEPDAGIEPEGFGVISGPCGELDDELTSSEGAFFTNRIDFGTDPYDDADYDRLTPGGREILDDGNAGGSSILSEVFSYEMLARCEGAVLLKTETEIVYDTPGKITDLLVEIDGHKIGVSVTRAVAFPFENPYSVEQARTLLEKKLQDIQASSANVSAEDAWVKQVLYVMAYGPGHAASLETAFGQIDASIRADTLLMVTVSDGDDAFLY